MTWVRVPPMTKEFLCKFFFGLVRLFFANFSNVSKGPPSFFPYFAKEWMFKNSQSLPLFHIFRRYATYRGPKKLRKKCQKIRFFFQFFPHTGTVEENTWHIEVLLLYLSRRYGADLGRSRLVFINIEVFSSRTPHIFRSMACRSLSSETFCLLQLFVDVL